MTYEQAQTSIGERFGVQIAAGTPLVVSVPVERWAELARYAKEVVACRFFSFLTAVDWQEQGLEVVARVDNLDDRVSLFLKTRLEAGLSACPSLTAIYRGADWMERECYDMFGIRFDGHPDLRRILLADDWEGHPLLKSYAVDTPYPPYR